MKRPISILLMLALFALPTSMSATTTSSTASIPHSTVQKKGIHFWMQGTIGGSEYAIMEMNGMTGTFEYASIKRKLKFSSYNRLSGQLIIKEYDLKGNYIGKFDGVYKPKQGSYKGVFTNTKGGKTNFTLWYGD